MVYQAMEGEASKDGEASMGRCAETMVGQERR